MLKKQPTNAFVKLVDNILASIDVKINGKRPWDFKVYNKNIYQRILKDGMIGVGEGYMAGEWDADKLDELAFRAAALDFEKILRNKKLLLKSAWEFLKLRLKKVDPFEIGRHHYDLGNNLFRLMLDKRMVYSCGY